jgi:glycosyltransferase involved in cell wall biosynthesis
MPKIDIIIPIYNQANKLPACLRSIFKQTFQDFSIIIVDDGSTDDLNKVIKRYTESNPAVPKHLQIIKQKHAGANTARNRGAKEATAEFIIFCDADIIMKPKMLERMYNALQSKPKAAYAYSSFRYGFKTFKLWPFDAAKLKKMPYIHTTSLIRRKLFPGFDQNLNRLQDWDLWLTMLENGYAGTWVPEVLFKIKPGGTKSKWLPSFAYKIFKKSKKVIAYNQTMKIIKEKHKLN